MQHEALGCIAEAGSAARRQFLFVDPKHEGSTNPVKTPAMWTVANTKGPSKPAKAAMHWSNLQSGAIWLGPLGSVRI